MTPRTTTTTPDASQTPREEPTDPRPAPAQIVPNDRELVLEDLVIEDVSIDGMCGVY
jgi:mycofactocin precursor